MVRPFRVFIGMTWFLVVALQAQAGQGYDPYDSLVAVLQVGAASTDKNDTVVQVNGVRRKVLRTGSGFCVARNHFVTNEHVVPEGASVLVWTLGFSPHPVEVVARDQEGDLALLRFGGDAELQSQPVTLSMKPWRSLGGREFYYPAILPIYVRGSKPELTQVQRRIYIVGTSAVHKSILFEPETMAGNSGSPIVQRDYSVVGVVQGNFLSKGWQGVAKAIPAEFVAEFLKKNGVEFAAQDN